MYSRPALPARSVTVRPVETADQPILEIKLRFSGDFDPVQITEVLGLRPSSVRRGGVPTPAGIIPPESGWDLRLAGGDGWDFEPYLLITEQFIAQNLTSLAEARHVSGAVLTLVLIAYTPRSLPGLTVPASLIALLANIDAEIVVDGMWTPEDSSSDQ